MLQQVFEHVFTSENMLMYSAGEILVLFSSAEGEGSNGYHDYVESAKYGKVVI